MVFRLLKNLKNQIQTKILERVPGKERFGNYRFLPFFVLFGASLEFVMINWTVGPNKVNFCNNSCMCNKNRTK